MTLKIEGLAKRIVRAVLLLGAISSGSMAASASWVQPPADQAAVIPPLAGIILAQASGDASTEALSSDSDLSEEINSDLLEDLVSQFLEDPAGFLADLNNADIIADIVREAIARNPANVDAVIAAVDGLSNLRIIDAVAEGIARAAADYAEAGDMTASSQILAKASITTSTLLGQAVQDKASKIAAETASAVQSLQDEDDVFSEQETPTDMEQVEVLSEGVVDAPSLSNAPGAAGDGDSTTLPSGGTISPPSSTGTTSPPTILTPPLTDDPASPA